MPETDKILGNSKIKDFEGLNTNCDPLDLKPAESVVQVNCGGPTPGVLRTRNGFVLALFDGEAYAPSTSRSFVVACPITSPAGVFMVYQDSEGTLYLAKNPG
jgi:hypothetical protein